MSWQIGLDLRAAREKVRAARALVEFPVFAVAMSTGALTYSKARAITRIADEHNASDLLDLALAATSNQLERFVSAVRRADPDLSGEERHADDERSVHLSTTGGVTEIVIRLPVEPGRVLLAAIDVFCADEPGTPLTVRRADALVELAEHAVATLTQELTPDPRYLATIHLSPESLDPEPDATPASCCCVAAGDGPMSQAHAIPQAAARRMLCDAAIEGIVHAANGDPLHLGRASRVVRRKLKRALQQRDDGCRFPGCTHYGWLDAHHIVHWLDGGATDIENLLLLCRRHHRLVHEEGWRIVGHPGGEFTFERPDGHQTTTVPPVRRGDRTDVDRRRRTAADGRCRWAGDRLDLHYAVSNHLENRALHRRGTS